MKKEKKYQVIWIIVMSLASLVMLVPIIMMFMTSFKTMAEIQSPVFHLLPEKFSLDNYRDAMTTGNWLVYF